MVEGEQGGEREIRVSCGRSCHRHLGRDRPLTLKLELVPLKRLLPAALEVGAIVVFRHTMLKRQTVDKQLGQSKIRRRRTVPQNSERQCGHCPTRRRAAELQRASASWNWQRFLAGMVMGRVKSGDVGALANECMGQCRDVIGLRKDSRCRGGREQVLVRRERTSGGWKRTSGDVKRRRGGLAGRGLYREATQGTRQHVVSLSRSRGHVAISGAQRRQI